MKNAMKTKFTDRVISVLLSAIMVFSSFPLSSYAEPANSTQPEETVNSSNYYLFVDQQTEFGKITDAMEDKEYADVYSDSESEDETSKLLYKMAQYEKDEIVNLNIEADDGFSVAEVIVERMEDENNSINYDYNEETNVLTFTMPDSNVLVSASFQKIVNEVDEINSDNEEIINNENNINNANDGNTESNVKDENKDIPIDNNIDDSTDTMDNGTVNEDIYIKEFSTQLIYGASSTDNGYVWNVNGVDKGHRFSFRINYAISGVGDATEGSVQFTVPKSILKDRKGASADGYEMSIPSKADVDAYLNETGESIDDDVNFAYYENGENIIIYNFRTIPAGNNGYIEMSYFTSQSTFNYVDMAVQGPFTCTMSVPKESRDADQISFKINTTANISSISLTYPVKYTKWNDSWGTEVKPENDKNYNYLMWTVQSYINATQLYKFTLDGELESNLGSAKILGYKFAGQSTFSAQNYIENQNTAKNRYDYILIGILLDVYGESTYWEISTTVTGTVDPVDNVDADTSKKTTRTWSWTKPVFSEPGGHFNGYKRADGAYRTYTLNNGYSIYSVTSHRAPSLGFSASEYTRYDLETFNGRDGNQITNTSLDGFKYASWIVGYSYPWTYDATYNNKKNPEAYGKVPVSYELIDDGVYLTNEDEDSLNRSDKLTGNDFYYSAIDYSWYMRDAELNDETQKFEEINVAYTDSDIIKFYAKVGDTDDWVELGSYNIKENKTTFDETYVKSMTNSNITFKDDVNVYAYKITTSNAHYYTEVFTVSHLVLKNSATVMNFVTDKDAIGINGNNIAHAYTNEGTMIFEAEHDDTEYVRVSQRFSDLDKKIVSVSNNTKKKTFTISWKINQSETMIWGSDGKTEFIPQNGGTFYDLLPEGSILDRDTIEIETKTGNFLSSSSYTVNTIDDFKGTGRTMLIVKVKVAADHYSLYYDTVHPWNSIKDYGTDVYNPVAYETGNDTITNGFADNGGLYNADGSVNDSAIRDAALMTGLDENSTGNQFIYTEKVYDIAAITAASSGLMKKVRAENDNTYKYETVTSINGSYAYQLRYMNSYTSRSKNMIFFDSIENYNPDILEIDGSKSDWRGILQSIDVNQLVSKGIAPVVYYSTITGLKIDENNDITDSSVWNVLTDSTDFTSVRAIAVDMRKTATGEDFVLNEGESVQVTLYMKAPATCPEGTNGYAYTYNNVYISDTVFNPANEDSAQNFLIHQDYTQVKLLVTGSFGIEKVNVELETEKLEGIKFRLKGTSSYGTEIDKIVSTDANGQIYFDKIEMGSYILQEYEVTDDWLLDTTEHKVVIDNSGKVWIDDVEYTDSYITITNNPRIHGDFSFFKKELGDDTTGIIGTTFRLSGTSDYGNEVLMYVASVAGGKVTFENVELGTYELVEVASNKNYTLNDIVYTVNIDETGSATIIESNEVDADGNPVSLEDSEWFKKNENGTIFIYNAYRYYEFEIRKVDAENTTIFLEGAIFSLTGVSDAGTKVDMMAISDKDGLVAFNGIEKGTYLLKETQAPQNVDANGHAGGTLNYLNNDTDYIVEIDYKGNVTINGLDVEENTGNFIIKNTRAYDKEIVITKIWNDGLTNEERIAKGLIPELHLTNRDLSQDSNFHTHTWDDGKVISLSTCAKNGETLLTCTDCGMTNIQKEAKLAHSWNEGIITVEPTCSSEGQKTFTCVNCGITKVENVAKTAHTPGTDMICTVCGEICAKYTDNIITGTGSATVTVSSSSYDYNNSSLRPYYAKMITFIPDEDGTYIFTASASSDTYGRLYDENMGSLAYDDDSGGSSQFKVTYANCKAGKVYYLAAGFYNSSNSGNITVTIAKQ